MVAQKRMKIKGASMVFVTTTVRDSTPLFSNQLLAHFAIDQLINSVSDCNATIAAYVLMPSQLHVLIGMQHADKLSKLMNNFKTLSRKHLLMAMAPEVKKKFRQGDEYVVWKPRFDDLIIWSEEQFRDKVEQIHNYPVKEGIVKRAEDYSFSSASAWLTSGRGLVKVDKRWSW